MRDAITKELKLLGTLVFILVSEIDDNLSFEETVAHPIVSQVILNPKLKNIIQITDHTLIVREIDNIAVIWSELESALNKIPETEVDLLKQALTVSLRNLRRQAYARLIVPNKVDDSTNYFLDKMVIPLREQLKLYREALQQLDTDNLFAVTADINFFNAGDFDEFVF